MLSVCDRCGLQGDDGLCYAEEPKDCPHGLINEDPGDLEEDLEEEEIKSLEEEGQAMSNSPKYHPNQMLKILHDWAKDIPPRPVVNVDYDASWGCFTYAFPLALIRIEEHELAPTDMPDMTPEQWIATRSKENKP